MLILTRRVGEAVMIGDDIKISVLGVKGNQIRLGVSAPREVAVHREEIYQRIQRENGVEWLPNLCQTDTILDLLRSGRDF